MEGLLTASFERLPRGDDCGVTVKRELSEPANLVPDLCRDVRALEVELHVVEIETLPTVPIMGDFTRWATCACPRRAHLARADATLA